MRADLVNFHHSLCRSYDKPDKDETSYLTLTTCSSIVLFAGMLCLARPLGVCAS